MTQDALILASLLFQSILGLISIALVGAVAIRNFRSRDSIGNFFEGIRDHLAMIGKIHAEMDERSARLEKLVRAIDGENVALVRSQIAELKALVGDERPRGEARVGWKQRANPIAYRCVSRAEVGILAAKPNLDYADLREWRGLRLIAKPSFRVDVKDRNVASFSISSITFEPQSFEARVRGAIHTNVPIFLGTQLN